jgi:tetratricopeptide (TPR) repeat protein
VEALQETVALAQELGDFDLLTVSLNNLATKVAYLGDLAHFREYLERSIDAAERTGNPARIGFVVAMSCYPAYYLGEWEVTRERAERGLEIARSIGTAWFITAVLDALGLICVQTGDWDHARRYLAEAAANVERTGDVQGVLQTEWAVASLDLLKGRSSEVRSRIELLLQMNDSLPEEDIQSVLPLLAEAQLDCADVSAAERTAQDLLARTRRTGYRIHEADALRVLGMVYAQQQRWQEARQALEAAGQIARDLPYPFVEAQTLYWYGTSLMREGKIDQARQRLDTARDLFQRLGARPYLRRTDNALSACAEGG